jgi:poly(3-hydroxybutyrate) depolymerase
MTSILKTRSRAWRAALLAVTLLAAAPLRADAPAVPPGVPPGVQTLSYKLEGAKDEISYALFVPSRYDAAKPAPLIVLLHGLFSNPDQVIHYQGITDEAERRGYIVVAPSGYNSHGWYGSMGPGNDFARRFARRGAAEDPANLGELSERDVLQVLERTRKSYAVDPGRIYLMGHSMGGGGTLYLAMKYPSLWTAIAPLAPAIYSSPSELEKARRIPAIVVQGESDRLVRASATRRWVDRMQELGMAHEYIEISGGDHVRAIANNPDMIRKVFDFFDAHRGAESARAKPGS